MHRALLWLCLSLLPLSVLAAPKPAATELEDRPEPIQRKQPQPESVKSRIEALSLFAAGRTEEEKGNLNAALRLYQRGLRFDPEAVPILRRVIDVAQQLDRGAEAVNYAKRLALIDSSDLRQVIAIAELLTERNEFDDALQLYELARSRPQVERKSAIYVTLTLQIGRLKFLTDDVKTAADSFAQVLEALDKPDEYGLNAETTRMLTGRDERNFELFGEALVVADRIDLAEKAFERALQRATSRELYKPVHAYHQAQILTAREKYSDALKQLQIYFDEKESRQEESPYLLLAKILEKQQKSPELLDRLAKLAESDPSNVPLNTHLGRLYADKKDWSSAEKRYRELLDTSSAAQGYRGLAAVYRQSDRPEELLKTLAESVEKAGGVESIAREAKQITADAKLLDSLVAVAKKWQAKSLDDLPQGARVVLAMMLLDAKRFDEAGEYFKLALQTKPKTAAELYFSWGLGLLNNDKHAEAAAVFQQGLDERVLPNDNPLFHTYLGLSLEMAGRTDEALKVARNAAQIAGGKNSRLESRVCWILYHAKRNAEAMAAYEKLLSRFDGDHNNEDNRRVMREARLSMSNICVLTGDMPKAEEFLEQILDEFPDDVSALNDLGYLWADQSKNLDRALDMTQRAVAADPDNEAYRDSLGWALYRLRRYDEALVELNKAADVDDPDGVILEHLADCQRDAGKTTEAQATYERALKKLQSEKEADKAASVQKKLQQLREKK
jgi:tetratricopeptide (TPR) repeat protein